MFQNYTNVWWAFREIFRELLLELFRALFCALIRTLFKVFDEPIYEDLSYSTDFGELFQESLFWDNWWHFGEMINVESFNPIVSRIEETTEKFIHCLSSELQIVEYIRAAVDFFTGQTGSLDTIGSFLSDAENGKNF